MWSAGDNTPVNSTAVAVNTSIVGDNVIAVVVSILVQSSKQYCKVQTVIHLASKLYLLQYMHECILLNLIQICTAFEVNISTVAANNTLTAANSLVSIFAQIGVVSVNVKKSAVVASENCKWWSCKKKYSSCSKYLASK